MAAAVNPGSRRELALGRRIRQATTPA